MNFPSFDDFLMSVGKAGVKRWIDDANNAKLSVQFPINQENANDFMTTVVSASLLTTQAMMRDYHEWLKEQFLQSNLNQDK